MSYRFARTHGARTAVAMLAVLALALSASACGGSEDDAAAGPGTDGASDVAAGGAGSDRDRIVAMLRELRADFNGGRGSAFCAHFTKTGREWFIESTDLQADVSCTEIVEAMAQARSQDPAFSPYPPARVLQAKIAGDEALVHLTGALAGSFSMRFAMIDRDGRWKIAGTDETVGRKFAKG